MNTPLITAPEELQAAVQRWSRAPWLTVDTEFVRVDTYHARLCLIQIGDGTEAACIDAVALSDLSPLLELLESPDSIKVFHAPGQDLEILVRMRSRCPAPLFDTQIAATLLGIGDQIGYAGLVERRLGIPVDKSLSRTDWARRPLREAELAYAAADVSHLAAIYPVMQAELAACGRLGWLAEDCARQCEPGQYATDPADAWQRLKGMSRMGARAQVIAAALCAWREVEAQARDRPRKWIIEDDAIYRIAERRPQTAAELENLAVLPPRTRERHGEALLAVVAEANLLPERILAQEDDFEPEQKMRLKALQAQVQAQALALNLPVSFLAPKAELVALVREGAAAKVNVLRGWRREVLGADLLARL